MEWWVELLVMFTVIPVAIGILFYLIGKYTKHKDVWPWIRKEKILPEYVKMQLEIEREARGQVLNLETGLGYTAVTAAKKSEVERVVAVEIDGNVLETAKRNAKSEGVSNKIDFREGDLFEPVLDERFDYIILSTPFLSARSQGVHRRFLKEVKNYLRPGGTILMALTTNDRYLTLESLQKEFEVRIFEEHEFYPEKRLYLSLCVKPHNSSKQEIQTNSS